MTDINVNHADVLPVSSWVVRYAHLVQRHGRSRGLVLDLACGSGRNARYFLARGHSVIAIDRDVSGIADLAKHDLCEIIEADLEGREYLPFAGRWFAAIAVTNYLHRPLFPALIAAIEPGGVLIYETFARGNERFGRPRNPDFLLQPGELLETVRGKLDVVAFEEGLVTVPREAVVQRICARKTPDADAIGPGPLPPPLLPSADP